MPGEREQPLVLHFLDDDLHDHVLVTGMSDVAARRFSRNEWSVQVDPEPLAKLAVVGDRPPNPRGRRVELNLFFDAVSAERSHVQPPKVVFRYATIWLHVMQRTG